MTDAEISQGLYVDLIKQRAEARRKIIYENAYRRAEHARLRQLWGVGLPTKREQIKKRPVPTFQLFAIPGQTKEEHQKCIRNMRALVDEGLTCFGEEIDKDTTDRLDIDDEDVRMVWKMITFVDPLVDEKVEKDYEQYSRRMGKRHRNIREHRTPAA